MNHGGTEKQWQEGVRITMCLYKKANKNTHTTEHKTLQQQ
jgi:hypothetical protein